jgi:hypothetical protein
MKMNMAGVFTVAIAVTFIIIAIALADWFLAKMMGIPVESVPLFAITFFRLLVLGLVIYIAVKFFGSKG